jgi:1-aminocyclopropane-1-carboxylate deaminase
MALSDFPRYPLLFGPSPVHRLQRLTDFLGGAEIWAKREDCNSGLAFGGNKTRKLEYLVPDALAEGATHLVTIGGVQSITPGRSPRSRPGSAYGRDSCRRLG